MCFVRTPEQTATFILYIINWLVFLITEVVIVYCAVGNESYKLDYVFKGLHHKKFIIECHQAEATEWRTFSFSNYLL